MDIQEFIEESADLEHKRWARWQRYLFKNCIKNRCGSLTIPAHLVKRWRKQIRTKYEDLSEDEKKSDRREVRKYINLLLRASAW